VVGAVLGPPSNWPDSAHERCPRFDIAGGRAGLAPTVSHAYLSEETGETGAGPPVQRLGPRGAAGLGDHPISGGKVRRDIAAGGGPLAHRLEQVCSDCDGTGIVVNEAWEEWHRQHEQLSRRRARADGAAVLVELLDTLIDQHENCPPTHPRQVPCEDCQGSGTVPTSEGEELLAFLRRHLHPHSGSGSPLM